MKACGIVTLITDFGLRDPYVGQVKGVLLSGCDALCLVDLTHEIPAFAIGAAAFVLHASYAYFPTGTVHLAIVDPGVGGERAIVAAAGGGHQFVAPDNGILSLLADDGLLETVHRIEPGRCHTAASNTFHGRDIMAPVAAALACGGNPGDWGPRMELTSLVRLDAPVIAAGLDRVQVPILGIDRFGNIRTALSRRDGWLTAGTFGGVEIGGCRIERLSRTYSEVAPGALLALFDSSGYLEIAANQASAAHRLGVRSGELITVHRVRGQ